MRTNRTTATDVRRSGGGLGDGHEEVFGQGVGEMAYSCLWSVNPRAKRIVKWSQDRVGDIIYETRAAI